MPLWRAYGAPGNGLNGTFITHYQFSHYEHPQVYGICCEGVADTAVTKDSAVIDTKQKGTCGKGPKSVPPTTVDSKNRIVGGTEARRGDWPFQVLKTCTNVILLVNYVREI